MTHPNQYSYLGPPNLTADQIIQVRSRVDRIAQPLALALLVWLVENPDPDLRHRIDGGAW